LAKITAPLLAINAADDERNPPITGLTEQAIAKIKGARLLLIPASPESRGHGSGGLAKLYAKELGTWLEGVPRRAAN
jgi:homoserine O-acetyltransferase